jgi:hypothetical protein
MHAKARSASEKARALKSAWSAAASVSASASALKKK